MAYTVPTTITAAELITVQKLNEQWIDNVSFLANPPACRVTKASQAVNDVTITTILYDTETFDTASLHSTSSNTNRITVPVTGLYMIGLHVGFSSDTDYDRVIVAIRNSAGGEIAHNEDTGTDISTDIVLSTSTLYKLTADDWVDSFAYQDNVSGGAGTVSATFWAVWVGLG